MQRQDSCLRQQRRRGICRRQCAWCLYNRCLELRHLYRSTSSSDSANRQLKQNNHWSQSSAGRKTGLLATARCRDLSACITGLQVKLVCFGTVALWPPIRVHRRLNSSMAPWICVVEHLLVHNKNNADPSRRINGTNGLNECTFGKLPV